jgi:hypothetical protein
MTGGFFWANGVPIVFSNYSNTNVGAYLSSGTISSNISTSSNIAITGNVYANYFIGSAAYLTDLPPTYANSNAVAYFSTFTGNISAGNVILQSTLYANTIAANIGNVVTISGTGALTVPVGSTAQRPAGVNGQIRYNTDDGSLEYYTAISGWLPVRNVVIDQAITGDGTTTQFTLSQPATATGLLVSVNGVLQNPNIGAYTVAGDQITFSEAPLASDSIDVRFIASLTSMPGTISNDLSVLGNLTVTGNITSLTGIYTYGNTQVGQYLNHLPGNIVPSANVTYSLGTSTNQWRDLWISNNTIYIGNTPITVSNGTLLINNTPITGGSTYSNTNVAAYIPTDATVTALQANVGGFYTWANTNFGTSSYSNTNVAAYLVANPQSSTYSDANVASYLATNPQGGNYSNVNVAAYIAGNLSTINANVTGANAAIVTANTAMKGYVDAVTTAWTAANTIQSNQITGANAAIVTANLAVVSYVNTQTNSLATGANTNTAAYLAAGISTNVTTTGNISAGNITVNGQPTTYGYVNGSYLFAINNTDQSVGQNGAVNFQTTSASNGSLITKTSNSQITLASGNSYKLRAVIGRLQSSSTWAQF